MPRWKSVCYQTFDLWSAMRADWPDGQNRQHVLRSTAADGVGLDHAAACGPAGCAGDRPMIQETTALGAAYLAGLPPASIPSRENSPTTGGWSDASSRR
jgi:glycerol kinase